jgi:PKD repeat protein
MFTHINSIKSMKKLFILSFFILAKMSVFAQMSPKFFGTSNNGVVQDLPKCDVDANERYIRENPHQAVEIERARIELENHTKAYIANAEAGREERQNYIITIVFHVLHQNGIENISDEQIVDQMRILNEDFNARNSDTSDVVDAFKGIIGNANIEFRLARLDPNGNPTSGITRTVTSHTNVGNDNSKSPYWHRSRYLNVWIVNTISSGAAGYTYLPQTVNNNASIDGIIVKHTYIGSIGTGSYSRSRTLTHEIGHWINLHHPWGPSNNPGLATNCNQDDGVSDTPNTIGWTSCNLNGISCGSLDNVQNYMDYAYCDRMFTAGQVARMRAALNSTVAQRNNLWQPATLASTGVDQLVEAKFSSANPVVCLGEFVNVNDKSYYGQTSWDWTFPLGQPDASTVQSPGIFYTSPGVYSATLNVSNGTVTRSLTNPRYVLVADFIGLFLPHQETFNAGVFPTNNWITVNKNDDAHKWDYIDYIGYTGGSMGINNFGSASGRVDDIITGSYDLSTMQTVGISFKLAFAQRYTTNNDLLRFFVSSDCGKTWNLVWIASGPLLASTTPLENAEFYPVSSAEWKNINIDNSQLNNYKKEAIIFKFEFTSDAGNNLFIDDFEVHGVQSIVPSLAYPRNYEQGISSSPTLIWKPISGVNSYLLHLDTDPAFSSANFTSTTTTATSTVPGGSDTRFEATGLSVNTVYYWRVRSITNGTPSDWSATWQFRVSPTGVGVNELIEETLSELNVYPNPSNDIVNMSFALSEKQQVDLNVFDISGRLVKQLNNKVLEKGTHQYTITDLPKGMYAVILSSGNNQQVKKFIVF